MLPCRSPKAYWDSRMQIKSFYLVGFHPSSYFWWLCGHRNIFPLQNPHIVFRKSQQIFPQSRQVLLKDLGRKKSSKAPHRWVWPLPPLPEYPGLSHIFELLGQPRLAKLLQSCRSITYLLLIHYPGLPFSTCCASNALGRMQKEKKERKKKRHAGISALHGFMER